MVDWGRIGLGVATGGMSELGGGRTALDAARGSDYTKDLLFGGKATASIDPRLQHYDQATNQLGQIAQGAAGRAAPVAQAVNVQGIRLGAPAQLATGQIDQSRGGMMGVANRLGAIAGGQAPGAGEIAVNRQVGQAQAAQHAMASMARGPASALAFRNAARNTADIGLAGAGQAAQAQMLDQQGANAQLGQVYGSLLGSDVNQAGQNAQFGQQAMLQQGQMDHATMLANAQAGSQMAIANLQAQLAQTGMNDAQQMQALGQMLGWDQATIQAQIQRAQVAAGDKGILPGLIGAGGQAAAAYATGGMSAAVPRAAAPAPTLGSTDWGP